MGTAARRDFINALSIGPFGMMIGGLIGGVLGDRLAGARRCSAASWRSPCSRWRSPSSTPSRCSRLLRFLAGVGLGGAMPNAATLASEYVPRRQRPVRGDADDRLHSARRCHCRRTRRPSDPGLRLAHAVHRSAASIPIVLALVLWKVLPESPRYLAKRRERWPELTRTHASNRPRHPGRR